ncbi:hypothetical protein [Spongiactinospora sp. 9N601]|uniref:hypothetical protein n=1 Tax=Spongiactinospora sp. 9N601 TaxID=3375149 RepID=UPI0037A9BBF2
MTVDDERQAAAGAAAKTPQAPEFGPQIDGYQPMQGQTDCDPAAKPGVVEIRDLLRATYGRPDLGISRDCGIGGQSEHKEGRALDYPFNANDAGQRAEGDALVNWMLATDQWGNKHAVLRRMGIMYLIWNRRIWATNTKAWTTYTGSSPHTDHVHISFGWPGARKQTTWWTGRGSGLGGPEMVLFPDGRIGSYAVQPDGHLHGRSQKKPGGLFTAWERLTSGGNCVGSPSVLQFADGTVGAYVRSVLGTVMGTGNANGPGSAFGPWQQTSPAGAMRVTGDPAMVLNADGTVATYAVLADGSLNRQSQKKPGGAFDAAWTRLDGGSFVGRPAVVRFPDRSTGLYVRTPTGTLIGTSDSGPGTGFGPWQQTSPGGAMAVAGDPEVILAADGTLHTYAVLADGSLNAQGQKKPGGLFEQAWRRLSDGGMFTGRPSVLQFRDGTLGVYVRGRDGNFWATGNADGPGSAFGPWHTV